MKAFKWIVTGAVLCVSSTLLAAESNRVTVSHYESLQRLEMQRDSLEVGQEPRGAGLSTLSFDALGRAFVLDLEPNATLLSGLAGTALANGIGVYRGSLAGNPDSWARIVVFNGMPRGLVWDGTEMFAIEAPVDSIVQTTSPIIYRLADSYVVPGTMSCGTKSLSGNGAAVYGRLIGELGTAMTQGPGAVSGISISAIGDFGFTSAQGGDVAAAAAIIVRLSNVDGIYSRDIGVEISVPLPVETHPTAATDPFTGETNPSLLLDELGNYRNNTPAHNIHGLTHLFTGRDLQGSTVGIAFSGLNDEDVLCQARAGAGLSEGNSSATFDALIAAHEIGHNFGAPHDGDMAESCGAELLDFIMAPFVSLSNDRFSACSIAIMQANAATAACVTPLPKVDMRVALTPPMSTVLFGVSTDLIYDLSNAGTAQATNVVADFTIPNTLSIDSVSASSGSCNIGTGAVNCMLGDVPGLSSETVTISTTPVTVGAGTLTAVVTADVDERPGNNQEALQITVDPAVDLAVSTPTAASINLDQSTTVNANLENRSVFDATGVTLVITLNTGLRANSASWSIGTCTVTDQRVDCQAANFASQSNSTLTLNATGTSAGARSYTVLMASNEADVNPANNNANGVVTVTDPAAKKSGAMGIPFLGLLGLAVFLMRRRSFAV